MEEELPRSESLRSVASCASPVGLEDSSRTSSPASRASGSGNHPASPDSGSGPPVRAHSLAKETNEAIRATASAVVGAGEMGGSKPTSPVSPSLYAPYRVHKEKPVSCPCSFADSFPFFPLLFLASFFLRCIPRLLTQQPPPFSLLLPQGPHPANPFVIETRVVAQGTGGSCIAVVLCCPLYAPTLARDRWKSQSFPRQYLRSREQWCPGVLQLCNGQLQCQRVSSSGGRSQACQVGVVHALRRIVHS